jgi:hypothetical protein
MNGREEEFLVKSMPAQEIFGRQQRLIGNEYGCSFSDFPLFFFAG